MRFKVGLFHRIQCEEPHSSSSIRPTPSEAEKWNGSFESLMASKYGQALFKAFLQREFSEENIEFWVAVETHRKVAQSKVATSCQRIYNDFIIPQAPKEVNLDNELRESLLSKMDSPSHTMFDQAQKRVQTVLEADAYSRFLQSDLYLELVHPERYQQESCKV